MVGMLGNNCACIGKENAPDRRQYRTPTRAARHAKKRIASDTSSPTISAEISLEDALRPIDLTEVVCGTASGSARKQIATAVVESLKTTGCLVVRDPRMPLHRNDTFLDLMEDYFSLPDDQKMKDCRPETSYQVSCCWEPQ
jgi:hypothetical protein